MIRFLSRVDEHRQGAELRAGGTDLMDRARRGLAAAEIDDLRDVPDLDSIVNGRVGAKVTLARLAADPGIMAGWPALAMAAGALATPQIRAVATVGGSLFQKLRCSYYRDPGFDCWQRGSTGCPALVGDRQMFAIQDGACISVHPSTVACALLLYDAGLEIDGGLHTVSEWLANWKTGVMTHLVLPAAEPGERGAYRRAIHRERAEWPLVEIAGRRVGSKVMLAVGGIAASPMRLSTVEAAVASGSAGPWKHAGDGFKPHPETAFKIPLMQNLCRAILEDLS